MAEAYIVDAIRTPVGKRNGSLSQVHPADLGAHVLKAIVERNKLDPAVVEDVVFGCLDTLGPQGGDIARTAWLATGYTDEVPGTTIDRQCGSSQQAVHFAAQGVMSGTQDVVIAGGVQNMSMIPIGTAWTALKDQGHKDPFSGSKGWTARYGDKQVSQFIGAEMMCNKWDLSRLELDTYAYNSHQKAIKAIDEGRFTREIVPFGDFKVDEGARRDTSMEKLATLKTLSPQGRMTAAVASQISDGSSAVLVVSERALKQYNLKPRARIHHMSVRGADPIWMLTAPIPATIRALKLARMKISDIDRVEINEAFAPVPMAWLKETGMDPSKVNVNGGAIALGHPLGATGAKLMATLLCELERSGTRYGLQTMCEGGGQANVTIIERLYVTIEMASGQVLTDAEALALADATSDELPSLLEAAAAVRTRRWGRVVTYSPKVFLPLTNLCRNRCDYCSFRRSAGDAGEWTMTPKEVGEWLDRARDQGCAEALFCLGDKPESSFPTYRETLRSFGQSSTVDYLELACRMALERGLLPHTNAEFYLPDDTTRLRPVNVSLGLMLENISPRLCEPGMPHHKAPDKRPARHVKMLREAGALKIPFTTGILLGIGETRRERVESLLAIREIHREFGHIQEVIVQNFRAQPGVPMEHAPEPDDVEIAHSVAMARLILDADVGIRGSSDLNPAGAALLLRAGINDFGGISPVSPDYINKGHPWPHIEGLAKACAAEGFELRPRLAVYPQYLKSPSWVESTLLPAIAVTQMRVEA